MNGKKKRGDWCRWSRVQSAKVTQVLAILWLLLLAAGFDALSDGISPEVPATQGSKGKDVLQARALSDRGFAMARRGGLKDALTLFKDAIEIDPTYAPAYYLRAAALLRMLDFAGAIPDLDKLITLDPHYPAAFNDRGFARLRTGDSSGALADLNRCIALAADWGLPYANRALVKATLGDEEGARADLSEALRIDPALANKTQRRVTATR